VQQGRTRRQSITYSSIHVHTPRTLPSFLSPPTPPSPTPSPRLSLHDALPISIATRAGTDVKSLSQGLEKYRAGQTGLLRITWDRSEDHTSELQSLAYLVCRLLLEKKKKTFQSPVTS